ncbi:MAG: polysaccharide deacetylase family protein, partial [Acidobacteriota bacterium]|nr:polysaccharide deacetylase family protein [Acidobacteriota bacterium]
MLEKQIDWLAKSYRLVPVAEIGAEIEHGSGSGKPIATLTFDDGYLDFYELAFPLLKRKGVPAALFVVTDLIDTTGMQTHDALYLLLKRRAARANAPQMTKDFPIPDITGLAAFEATRRLIESLPSDTLNRLVEFMNTEDGTAREALQASRSVTWEMIREMQRAGITIGSHTRTHVLLPNESQSRANEEALGSQRALTQRLGAHADCFAFPSGAWDDVSLDAVKAAGYRYGFTTCGHHSRELPLLTIPRTLLWERSCLGSDGRFSGPVMSCLI